jgi:NAD(P)-dependent dehydrogenase (short-subunit alcohol dehydrogenase family)
MRVVVVGASSGLGRCIGIGLGQAGDDVALMARRADRLKDAAAEAGGNTVAIACDATDAASCQSAMTEAVDHLGGIDALVYTPAIGPLQRIEDITADEWRRVFDTNVVGASMVAAAALPHLKATNGTAAFLTSVSASLTPPWPGLASYAVTKAALDKLVDAWRAEHPSVGFSRVVVGECAGGTGDAMTEFANGWDGALAGEFMPGWFQKGYMSGTLMPVERLVSVVRLLLQAGGSDAIPQIVVTPRPPA